MLGFSPISDVPISDLAITAAPPPPPPVTTTAPAGVQGLIESDGQRGGYLVPTESLSLAEMQEGFTNWARLWEPGRTEAEDEEDLLSIL
jgi:hypothetical protein